MEMKIAKVYWQDHKPIDNNNGYIYGIEYQENPPDGEVSVEWYKTEKARNQMFVEYEQARGYKIGWHILSILLKPIYLFKPFIKSTKWYFIFWDKNLDILELELFGKHIFYLDMKY